MLSNEKWSITMDLLETSYAKKEYSFIQEKTLLPPRPTKPIFDDLAKPIQGGPN
jgi:hypothetical protein